MARYGKYKNSGVKWLGSIPNHWDIIPLKFIVTCNDACLSPVENADKRIKYVEISDVDSVTGVNNYTEYNLKEAPSRARRITEKNDVIISTVRTYLKAVAKINENDLIVSTGFAVLRSKKIIHSDFLYYLILSDSFVNRVISYSVGTSYPAITTADMLRLKVCVPPLDEQKSISDYLDAKVRKIDEAIKQQQKMIELLNERRQIIISEAVTKGLNPEVKMKDSGTDWMGRINSKWRIYRLKYLIKQKLMYGANESAEDANHNHPRYIRITDVNENGKLREDTYRSLPPEKAQPYLLSQGDILLARSGATAGKSFLFDLDINACYAGYLIKATPNDKIASKYLYYYTKSGIYERWCQSILIQATIQNIGADKYANLLVPLPSLDEQDKIISYLDKKIEKIDKIITASLDKIAILSERKKIIINEAVTGKIKVL